MKGPQPSDMMRIDMPSKKFRPNCLPLFVGSLPVMDYDLACNLVQTYSPAIPSWSQMPGHDKYAGMVAQFAPGIPGLKSDQKGIYVDQGDTHYEKAMLHFYETYLAATEEASDLNLDQFALRPQNAPGFHRFLERLHKLDQSLLAVKGQITGPFTMGTGIKDRNGRAIFHDDVMRDMLVKLLVLKARWQVIQLVRKGVAVILSIDEPGLAGFGSSEFISISRDDVVAVLSELVQAIQDAGAMAGVHVCANTDWSMLMTAGVDLISFDAYNYFDRVALYQDELKQFVRAGKWLAWGIVPSLDEIQIEAENTPSLVQQLKQKIAHLDAIGIDRAIVLKQSLITPSCGLGTLSTAQARTVMQMTKEVSDTIRKEESYA
jgi:methionine synthase II (cobalamin-independent)